MSFYIDEILGYRGQFLPDSFTYYLGAISPIPPLDSVLVKAIGYAPHCIVPVL